MYFIKKDLKKTQIKKTETQMTKKDTLNTL